MSYHKDTTLSLYPETFFHIYNRGNKGIKIFYQEKNYVYFLRKYAAALSNYVDTYTYCLIPNHFHFIIKVKSESDIMTAAIDCYNNIPKSMWNSIKSYAEEFHPRYFENHPKFLRYVVVKQLDERIHLKELIEILPDDIKTHLACWLVSDAFRKFFGAYARAINKQENENGSLFQKNFRRKIIDSDIYFTQLVWYLHNNGVHHGLCKNFKDYVCITNCTKS